MPVASPQGFFHQEAPLEFDDIADLQEIETGDADLAFMRKYEYKGVLLVEIVGRPNTTSTTGAVKRQRVDPAPFARLVFLAPLLTLRFTVTPRLPTTIHLKAMDFSGKQEGSWPDSSTSALD